MKCKQRYSRINIIIKMFEFQEAFAVGICLVLVKGDYSAEDGLNKIPQYYNNVCLSMFYIVDSCIYDHAISATEACIPDGLVFALAEEIKPTFICCCSFMMCLCLLYDLLNCKICAAKLMLFSTSWLLICLLFSAAFLHICKDKEQMKKEEFMNMT